MPYQERGYGRRNRSEKKHNGAGKFKHTVGEKGKEVLENIDANSEVLKCFQQYASELDYKHDKYERIVKLSRDITIESKRVIFLLHTLDRESKREAVLTEASLRLSQLVDSHFKNIAKELRGEDAYQYLRAYTAGLQEYIEAATFLHYIKHNNLQDWTKIQRELTYTSQITESTDGEPKDEDASAAVATVVDETQVTPLDYILGVADLTGELMRKCINNLGSGNIEGCYHTSTFVRDIYSRFLGISFSGFREISRKLVTLRQSLAKMEYACYTIHVRGSEIPKHMLADVISSSHDDFMDEDEGFY